ncbi:MAG TPA: hypothetical protein VI300_05345 [Solirubrobacter sp.]
MTARPLPLAAALLAALTVGASRADAATFLGSQDTSATPDGFACADCAPGLDVGFRQFALRLATVDAPEDGVITTASVNARRIAGTDAPRIAVLRPADDGVSLTVAASAPLPLSGDVSHADDLHLPMQRGDALGFLYHTGEVALGVRNRPRPDGAIQSLTLPCAPCGMDGGTGTELLFDAVLEPDVDQDGLGDETQDPDGGGLGPNWTDDWFRDWDAGDGLDDSGDTPDFGDSRNGGSDNRSGSGGGAKKRKVPKDLRLLESDRRGMKTSLLISAPKAGMVSASVTLPGNAKTGAGPFTTILTGQKRVKHAGLVRLRLASTPAGARVLARRKHVRTKVVVAYFPRKSTLSLLMRSARF